MMAATHVQRSHFAMSDPLANLPDGNSNPGG
jgi:hypothetical protein